MVPRLLAIDQKPRGMEICRDTLERLETEPNLLPNVVKEDESWIFEYDLEIKRQSLKWKSPYSPKPNKARKLRSKIKVMLIALFDTRSVVQF